MIRYKFLLFLKKLIPVIQPWGESLDAKSAKNSKNFARSGRVMSGFILDKATYYYYNLFK